jgi:hypothetical protein
VQRLEYEVLALVGDRSNTKVGRIEIILTGNSDQREQGVAASIDQSGAHALWARLLPGPIATTDWLRSAKMRIRLYFYLYTILDSIEHPESPPRVCGGEGHVAALCDWPNRRLSAT